MEIKLKASLRAYGKFNKMQFELPTPTKDNAQSFLGVDDAGNYALFKNANNKNIESLFDSQQKDDVTSDTERNDLIDSLF